MQALRERHWLYCHANGIPGCNPFATQPKHISSPARPSRLAKPLYPSWFQVAAQRSSVPSARRAHSQAPATMDSERLQRYFDRIKLQHETVRRMDGSDLDSQALRAICSAHAEAIPFENLDLVYEPAKSRSQVKINLDLDSLYNKLVLNHRGGYCFETNGLLAQALKAVGFDCHSAAARVVTERPKHTDEVIMGGLDHQVIFVRLGSEVWICDAGFGGQSPRLPVPLTGTLPEMQDPRATHRVIRGMLASSKRLEGPSGSPHKEGWFMQRYSVNRSTWDDLYFFTDQEWRQEDFEIPNFWCSNRHPLFCKQIVVALQTKDGRKTISGTKLRFMSGNNAEEHDVSDPVKMAAALKDHFGLIISQ